MAERRIRPIGDDDDSDDDGPQNVGDGCASLTPDQRVALDNAVEVVLRLRAAGATYVKTDGADIEVSFRQPESSGGKQ